MKPANLTRPEPRLFEVLIVGGPACVAKLPRLRTESEVAKLRAHGWTLLARQVEVVRT